MKKIVILNFQDDTLLSPRGVAPPPGIKSPTPGKNYGLPNQPKSVQRRQANFSAGKPPAKFTKEQLMRSEGIIPLQGGTNKFASQKLMTGFGTPRDVVDKVKADNIAEVTDEKKIEALKASTWLQSGTNKFASQKGMTGIILGCFNYKLSLSFMARLQKASVAEWIRRWPFHFIVPIRPPQKTPKKGQTFYFSES